MMEKVEYALRLAELGCDIFPVIAGTKRPKAGYSWLRTMSRDPNTIRQWFDEDPDMNYAVHPGETMAIVDLDVKPDRDGRKFLSDLESDLTPDKWVSQSFEVRTPSGGRHIYVRVPHAVGLAHRFPKDAGIDVRGYHGYVVGPGCAIGERAYEADGDISEIMDAPDWLVEDYFRRPGEKDANRDTPLVEWDMECNVDRAVAFLEAQEPAIEGQNGNDHTFETAAAVRDFAISEEKCVELMVVSGWNAECSPPWDVEELSDIVEHAYRYGQNRPGERADFMSMYESGGIDDALAQELASAPAPTLPRDHLYNRTQWMKMGRTREYVIPEWLVAHGFTAVLAKMSTGKSTILLDLVCRVACGMDWWGLPVKDGYKVVYLCGEDVEGFILNTIAWERHHGRQIPDDRMLISDEIANLMSSEDTRAWIEAIKSRVGDSPAIVVFDTWQRATAGGAQNRDEDMQASVRHVEALGKALGAPVLCAFHPPKDGRQTILGSSVIENSTTGIWNLEDTPLGKKLTVSRIKGPGYGNYRLFNFQEFEMDEVDSFGRRQKGLVAVSVGGTQDEDESAMRMAQERVREAWAQAVRFLIEADSERGPDEERIGDYTASKLAGAMATALIEDEEYVARCTPVMRDAGIHSFTKMKRTTLYNYFLEHFETDPRPHLYSDGFQLTLSRKRKFEIKEANLPKETE